MIERPRLLRLIVLMTIFVYACGEPAWDEEEYVSCIENIDLNCYEFLPEMSFRGIINDVEFCYSHGVAGYQFETTSYGRATTPASDPAFTPDTPLHGIGLCFRLLSPKSDNGRTHTSISLCTNAIHPDSFEMIQFLEDLSTRDVLPLEKAPEGPKLDGFNFKLSKSCPEFRPESLTSGSGLSTSGIHNAVLRHIKYKQPKDALRLKKVKITNEVGLRIFDLTFEIKNLRMYYQIDSDIHEYGTIEHAIFNTRTEVEL